MAAYTEQEKRILQQVPIQSILRTLGKSVEHRRGGMYWSPFREERTPSFHISDSGNVWYDFGLGVGGSALSLVCRLLGCSGARAYDFLASVSTTFIQGEAEPRRAPSPGKGEARIRIIAESACFTDAGLKEYALSRGISERVLSRWCSEVTFSTSPQGRRTRGIGFRNNSGGLVLRTPLLKRCTSSDITTVNCDGERSSVPFSPACIVMEGMFDFLSLIEISKGTAMIHDVCILNSVNNLPRAAEWIAEHRDVCLMLDRDAAGRETAGKIELLCREAGGESVIIDDWSILYEGHKDLNDRLVEGADSRKSLTHQYQSLWNRTLQRTFRKD